MGYKNKHKNATHFLYTMLFYIHGYDDKKKKMYSFVFGAAVF